MSMWITSCGRFGGTAAKLCLSLPIMPAAQGAVLHASAYFFKTRVQYEGPSNVVGCRASTTPVQILQAHASLRQRAPVPPSAPRHRHAASRPVMPDAPSSVPVLAPFALSRRTQHSCSARAAPARRSTAHPASRDISWGQVTKRSGRIIRLKFGRATQSPGPVGIPA